MLYNYTLNETYTFLYYYIIVYFSFITCNQIVNNNFIYSSLQINLPESVTKKYNHSVTTYEICNNRVWIIVNGAKEYNRSDNTSIPVTGWDVTTIVELGMIINIM